MFAKYKTDKSGKKTVIRNRVVVDCQKAVENGEKTFVEQSHIKEVEINSIVKKHGVSRLALTREAMELRFDDVTTNDFQEAMNLIKRGNDVFQQLSSQERAEFNNSPEQYLDYVHNPENREALIERGWMNPPPPDPAPQKVEIVNQPATETPLE